MKTKQLNAEYLRLNRLLGERCRHILTPEEIDAFLRFMCVCARANEAGMTPPSAGPGLASVEAKLAADPEASALIDRIGTVTDALRKRKRS